MHYILSLRSNVVIGLFLFFSINSFCQVKDSLSLFKPSPHLNQKRLNLAIGTAAITYTGFSIGLYHTWYKQYPSEGFHFFNDWNEWQNVDKVGHIYSAHIQASLLFKSAKWTGLNESKSILWASLLSGVSQTTIEIMDAFSSQWGFSVADFGANLAGIGLFASQQKAWKDQRMVMKVSSWPNDYNAVYDQYDFSNITRSAFGNRANQLYGSGYVERYLKDYNAQTLWLSANIKSFFPNAPTPSWLNIAVGYGAENMLGGFKNEWNLESDQFISVDQEIFPRYQQFYLAFDVDFNRINTRSPFLKSVFSLLNLLKAPSPAIEINSLGELRYHLVFL